MQIITISGLDGSGKSTQIELLKKYLESQGKKVFYFHAIDFGLANKISSLSCCHNEKVKNKNAVTKSGFLGIISRRMFLMADLLRFRLLLRKLKKEKFDFLVSDRYFYDTVVNIEYLMSRHSERSEESPKRSFAFAQDDSILKPDKAIYLKTSPENIMSRERKPEQGMEYLKDKEKLYDDLAEEYKLKIIDGNRDKEEIFEEIKGLIL